MIGFDDAERGWVNLIPSFGRGYVNVGQLISIHHLSCIPLVSPLYTLAELTGLPPKLKPQTKALKAG
jgi:hypothetical protein